MTEVGKYFNNEDRRIFSTRRELKKPRGSRRKVVFMIEYTVEYVIEGKRSFNEEDRCVF